MTIRLDEATKNRMRRVSKRLRLTHSALIRLGLLQTLAEMESGRVTVPVTDSEEAAA